MDARPDQIITTANELHIPVGQRVRILLDAPDVIHSFWVPSLAGKQDLIPGRDNEITIDGRDARALPRAMRRVLRPAARAYGLPGDCRPAGRVRGVASGPTQASR